MPCSVSGIGTSGWLPLSSAESETLCSFLRRQNMRVSEKKGTHDGKNCQTHSSTVMSLFFFRSYINSCSTCITKGMHSVDTIHDKN
jgi:hypothetical protein